MFNFSITSNVRNVPYDWINKQKSNQHWLRKEGEKFLFPGGGTMFPNGVGEYVDLMQDLIPGMKDGTVRTAIDTGCGVSFTYFIIFFLGIYLANKRCKLQLWTFLLKHQLLFFLTAMSISDLQISIM